MVQLRTPSLRSLTGTLRHEPHPEFDEIPLPRRFLGIPDGRYAMGLRPHHLSLHRSGPDDVALTGWVSSTEITGSETFIHMRVLDDWIVLAHGIHDLEPGLPVDLYFNLENMMLFGEDLSAVEAVSDREEA